MSHRSALAVGALILLALPLAPAQAEVPCQAVFIEFLGEVCPREGSGYDVFSSTTGAFLGSVHGPDPAPRPSTQSFAAPPPVKPTCVAPGTAYSMRVLHARMPGVADRSATMRPQIVEMVHVANAYVANAGARTGIGVSLRVQCAGGNVDVTPVQLTTSVRQWKNVTDDLVAQGYNDPTVKYWVWHDDGTSTCAGGVGSIYTDDRPGAENWNNGNGVALFAITWSCMGLDGARVMLHELGHNHGAVQRSAPHATNTSSASHCYDGRDTMCYNDGGDRGHLYSTAFCAEEVFDCRGDDYFNATPPSGSYLATHWNVASTNNRFLLRTGCSLDARGPLVAGLPTSVDGGGVFGVNIQRQPIPSSCWGRPFGLVGVGGGAQDFDLCLETDAPTDNRLACHVNDGSEQGVIPTGTTRAGIFYAKGALGQWRLSAS